MLEGTGDVSRVAKFLGDDNLAAKRDALQDLIRAWVAERTAPERGTPWHHPLRGPVAPDTCSIEDCRYRYRAALAAFAASAPESRHASGRATLAADRGLEPSRMRSSPNRNSSPKS